MLSVLRQAEFYPLSLVCRLAHRLEEAAAGGDSLACRNLALVAAHLFLSGALRPDLVHSMLDSWRQRCGLACAVYCPACRCHCLLLPSCSPPAPPSALLRICFLPCLLSLVQLHGDGRQPHRHLPARGGAAAARRWVKPYAGHSQPSCTRCRACPAPLLHSLLVPRGCGRPPPFFPAAVIAPPAATHALTPTPPTRHPHRPHTYSLPPLVQPTRWP